MSTTPRWKNQLITLLALTTVAAGGLALHQHRQLTELERNGRLSVITTTSTPAAPKAYLDGNTRPSPTETVAAEDDNDIGGLLSDDAAAQQPRQGGNDRRRDWAARMTQLMEDPDFVEAWKIQQRARLDGRYADLFRQLNLPPDRLARFQDLLIERQNAWQDVMTTARQNGLNPRENRDELREMTRALQAEVDATIKAELGDQTYAAYQTYDSTQAQRNVVNQLNQKLTYSGSSLSTAQSRQLVTIIANNGGSLNDQTINLAQGLLTADQTAALRQIYAEQSAAAIVREKMRSGGGR